MRGFDRPNAHMLVSRMILDGTDALEAVRALCHLSDHEPDLFEAPPPLTPEPPAPRRYTTRRDRWDARPEHTKARDEGKFVQPLPLNAIRDGAVSDGALTTLAYLLALAKTLAKTLGNGSVLTTYTSSIATALGLERSTVRKQCDVLEQAGYMNRVYNPRTRMTTYYFTEKSLVVPYSERPKSRKAPPVIHRTADLRPRIQGRQFSKPSNRSLN